MALSTIENKIAYSAGVVFLGLGTVVIGLSALVGKPNIMAVSTGAYALSGATFIARALYDQAGQKLTVWQTLRAAEKAVGIASASDVEKVAARLQELEHAIDHRVDVVTDSATQRGQVAMGAWVHAAKDVLAKAQLFDIAASPVDKDPSKLTSGWTNVARQIMGRVEGYERMLTVAPAQPVVDTIINYEYPTT